MNKVDYNTDTSHKASLYVHNSQTKLSIIPNIVPMFGDEDDSTL